MNDRSLAINILQDARDRLSARLTQRIVEARDEIAADAEGGSYLSEIETIYDQLGSRLAHVNAMLSNLPPSEGHETVEPTATEIIYADLASASSAGFELEPTEQPAMLGLPAPSGWEERPKAATLADTFRHLTALAVSDDLAEAARLISECFDLPPSHARRCAAALSRRVARYPDLARRLVDLAAAPVETDEQALAGLLCEAFDTPPAEAAALAGSLRRRADDGDHGG